VFQDGRCRWIDFAKKRRMKSSAIEAHLETADAREKTRYSQHW